MFSSVSIADSSGVADSFSIVLTLAFPYSWHSTADSRRMVIWTGVALKVVISETNPSPGIFSIEAYSIPSLESTQFGVAFTFKIISETQARLYHEIESTTLNYVPNNSVFRGTPNFNYILLFSFFN